jgi:hypothetical protein
MKVYHGGCIFMFFNRRETDTVQMVTYLRILTLTI